MPDRDVVLQELLSEYDGSATDAVLKLYRDEPPALAAVYASFHTRINELLKFLNSKIYGSGGGHFNADPSREFIELLREMQEVRKALKRVGITMEVREDYEKVLEECDAFLVQSGGSPIPEGFQRVELERFEPVISTGGAVAPSRSVGERPQMHMVGEGSFAIVYRFRDPVLDIDVALKVARKGLSYRDLERFRKEYELLKALDFPYIVRAYRFDDVQGSYTMEFCDTTLYDYVQLNNAKLTWSARKRVSQQFLYGINYLHQKGVLHRDISRKNVLLRVHDLGAVTVKLSDFGLHKAPESDFTKIDSSMKGTIVDPTLERFADFTVTNDIYAVGHVLSYIFSGRSNLDATTGPIREIVDKCTHRDVAQRYALVAEVIVGIDRLSDPATAGAGTPA